MWEMKIARLKADEYMIIRVDMEEWEVKKIEYLTSDMKWSRWKVDAKIYFNQTDARSAFITKKIRWEKVEPDTVPESVPEPENPFEKAYQKYADTWSDLSLRW